MSIIDGDDEDVADDEVVVDEEDDDVVVVAMKLGDEDDEEEELAVVVVLVRVLLVLHPMDSGASGGHVDDVDVVDEEDGDVIVVVDEDVLLGVMVVCPTGLGKTVLSVRTSTMRTIGAAATLFSKPFVFPKKKVG